MDSIGIYYDGEFVSVPNVQAEITGGNAQISGMADAREAENLASTIRIGGLKLETIDQLVEDPSKFKEILHPYCGRVAARKFGF